MKKSFIIASVLLSGIMYAQEKKDSMQTNNLDEVIINTFIKKDTESTNKMPLKFIENPQVFSSIDKSLLENQVIFTVDDAYRNVTGLQKLWNPTNRAGDGGSYITMRGFASNNSLRNGLVAPVTTTIDAINVEKVEVLKGPSATLFGSNYSSYGGVINRVTKKPYEDFGGSINISGGSYNFYRAQADINTPLTNDKKLLFRLNTAYTNTGTFQKKDAQNTSYAFTPSLTYKVNDRLDFNVEFEMFENKGLSEQSFFYMNADLLGTNNIKDLYKMYDLDYKQSYVGDNLKQTSRSRNIFGQINYKINDHIKSTTSVSNAYSYSNGFGPYFSFQKLSPESTDLFVARADQSTDHSRQTNFQVQQNFNFDYKFGNMRNRTLVGFDFTKLKDRQKFIYFGDLPYFDIVPAKGGDYSSMNGSTLAEAYRTRDVSEYISNRDLNIYSAYISNVFTPTEGLNIMAAVRLEHNDYRGGKVFTETDPYKNTFWSPKFGLVYEIIPTKFSVFGNYQNSFKNLGYYLSEAGATALAKPEQANQIEGGFKTNLLGGKVNATLSYYNINVKNTLMASQTNINALVQAGKLRSEGVELEVNAYLVKGFSLVAGVSYNDTKLVEAAQDLKGLRPTTSGSPWLANFNASYQFLDGAAKGLGFGIGGNYAGDNKVINSSTGYFILPEYFTLNANAFYDAKKFRIGVKVDNLTNQKYWIGYTTANPQQLINAVGSLTYKF